MSFIASFTFSSTYISRAWFFYTVSFFYSANYCFIFFMTSYFRIPNSLESMSSSTLGFIGFFSKMIEFFTGEVYLSTIIFSFAPGRDILFLLFDVVLKSIIIFSFSFFEPLSRTLKLFKDFDAFIGEDIFCSTILEIGGRGSLFLKLFYAAIIRGFFREFKSYTLRLLILFLYYSERY